MFWPFLNEVILLERNPLFGGAGQISTLKPQFDLAPRLERRVFVAGRWRGRIGAAVGRALWATDDFLLENVLGFHAHWFAQAVALQVVLWLVAIYFTAARFLSYLDQRIRIEGWEVELLLAPSEIV